MCFINAASSNAKVTLILVLRENWTMQYFFVPFLCVKTPREAGRGDDEKMPDSKSINNATDLTHFLSLNKIIILLCVFESFDFVWFNN